MFHKLKFEVSVSENSSKTGDAKLGVIVVHDIEIVYLTSHRDKTNEKWFSKCFASICFHSLFYFPQLKWTRIYRCYRPRQYQDRNTAIKYPSCKIPYPSPIPAAASKCSECSLVILPWNHDSLTKWCPEKKKFNSAQYFNIQDHHHHL